TTARLGRFGAGLGVARRGAVVQALQERGGFGVGIERESQFDGHACQLLVSGKNQMSPDGKLPLGKLSTAFLPAKQTTRSAAMLFRARSSSASLIVQAMATNRSSTLRAYSRSPASRCCASISLRPISSV